LLSVWTNEIKYEPTIIFFPLHRIASNRIVSNRIEIESHCFVTEVNRIASCFICIFDVSYYWLCIEMRIASASVMEMHIPNIYIWRNDIPFSCFTYNKMNNILCYCGHSIVNVISVNSPLRLLSRLCLLCFHGLS